MFKGYFEELLHMGWAKRTARGGITEVELDGPCRLTMLRNRNEAY